MIGVGHHRDTTIRLNAGDTARVAFTGHQPPLPVAREAVGPIGGLLHHTDASAWGPSYASIVADIAQQEIPAFVPPQRPFGRTHVIAEAVGQFFHLLPWRHDAFQGRMMLLDGHALLLLGCALWHKTCTGGGVLGLVV